MCFSQSRFHFSLLGKDTEEIDKPAFEILNVHFLDKICHFSLVLLKQDSFVDLNEE